MLEITSTAINQAAGRESSQQECAPVSVTHKANDEPYSYTIMLIISTCSRAILIIIQSHTFLTIDHQAGLERAATTLLDDGKKSDLLAGEITA